MNDFRGVLYYDDASQLPPADNPLLVLAVRIVEIDDNGTLRQYVHGVQPGLGIRYGRIFGDPFGSGVNANPPLELVGIPAVGSCVLATPARGTATHFPGSPVELSLPGGSQASANWVTVTGGALDEDAVEIAYDDSMGEIELLQRSIWQVGFSLGAEIATVLAPVITAAIWDYTVPGAEVLTNCRAIMSIPALLSNVPIALANRIALPERAAHSKYRLRLHSTLAVTAQVYGWTQDYTVLK